MSIRRIWPGFENAGGHFCSAIAQANIIQVKGGVDMNVALWLLWSVRDLGLLPPKWSQWRLSGGIDYVPT